MKKPRNHMKAEVFMVTVGRIPPGSSFPAEVPVLVLDYGKEAEMAKRNGHDSLGKFVLQAGECRICKEGKHVPIMTITYTDKPKVNAYVAKAKALLIRNKRTGAFIRTLGINCGCYAKVQRQIKAIELGHYAYSTRDKKIERPVEVQSDGS